MGREPQTQSHTGPTDQSSAEGLARAFAEFGLDPSTAPDLSQPSRSEPPESPDEFADRIVREHLANDLTSDEAAILAAALWKRHDRDVIRRTREAFRLVSFATRYGVPIRSIPDPILPERIRTSGISSTLHRWFLAGIFQRAQRALERLPFHEWSQDRREELAAVAAWEAQIIESSVKRRAARLYEQTQPKRGKTR